MGWYYTTGASRASLIRELTRSERNEKTGWARDHVRHTTAGNVLWTVWEITAAADGSKRLVLGCDLLRPHPDGWGHKPMCEDDGPCYYTCPLAYLELVPETNPGWRAHVRAYWERRRQARERRRAPRAAG